MWVPPGARIQPKWCWVFFLMGFALDVELHCYVSYFVVCVEDGIFLDCLLSGWWDICDSLQT